MANDTCRVTECARTIHHKRNQLCKMHQQRMDRRGTTDLPPKRGRKACDIEGCDRNARSKSAAYCPMHYHRAYRHGSTDKVTTTNDVTVSHGRLYHTVYAPGHPVAGKRGMAYEHRVVLYDLIGEGLHQCHWCDTDVLWDVPKGHPNALQVDHKNAIGNDNRPENLVPSCQRCNTARGGQARHRALLAAGYWSAHDTVARTGSGRSETVA